MAIANRLKSLDALRGFDMFWIVSGEGIVHGLASATGYTVFLWMGAQLHHSSWNGFTFYDLIFPLFIFIAGVAMPFSIGKKLENLEGAKKKQQKRKIYQHLLLRCIILILLGMIINGDLAFLPYAETRFASVLGRIGLSCFFAAMIYMNTTLKQQVLIFIAILLGYSLLMTLVPVPGYGAGVSTPEGSLASYIDRLLLPGKILRGSYDPEGILSTIPAIGTAMLGIFAGWLLRSGDNRFTAKRKCLYLLLAGGVLLLLGTLWGYWTPINKNIWSSSFVLYCGGWSALLLGIFYAVIDLWHIERWCRPFIWLGMNSILIYMAAHGAVNFLSTVHYLFGGLIDKVPATWQLTGEWVGVALIQFSLLYFLYRKRIFWKI